MADRTAAAHDVLVDVAARVPPEAGQARLAAGHHRDHIPVLYMTEHVRRGSVLSIVAQGRARERECVSAVVQMCGSVFS